jgi:hypothetical protein
MQRQKSPIKNAKKLKESGRQTHAETDQGQVFIGSDMDRFGPRSVEH